MLSRPLLVFQLFLRSSRVQKKRAILTVAAIAWGSLSLLLLLSFGEGLKRQLTLANAGMGQNIAVMWPGETTMPWNGMPAGRPVRPGHGHRFLRTSIARWRSPALVYRPSYTIIGPVQAKYGGKPARLLREWMRPSPGGMDG